ncbi:CapA family protein [Arthrobacter sp. B2a2-09]|nr:CapA family protein [Arthrobacter sp. B2a2-09]
MLGRLVNEQLKVAAPDYPWGDTLPVLRQADISFANLECSNLAAEPWSGGWDQLRSALLPSPTMSRAGRQPHGLQESTMSLWTPAAAG